MKLAKIIEELGRVGLSEYPTPRVAGAASALVEAASALVEAYREATAAKANPAPVPESDLLPAAGSGPFNFRDERF